MSRTSLLAATSALLFACGCGAKDSLLQEWPVEAGTQEAGQDSAAVLDQSAPDAKDTNTPGPEASADTSTSADVVADTLPIFDGPVPDTGVHTTKSCQAEGGVLCTAQRWILCPIGFEPVAAGDSHFNCGEGGWCCQPAPSSTCSMSGAGNCIVNACTGCFAPVPNTSLTCETGRVCCVDMCD